MLGVAAGPLATRLAIESTQGGKSDVQAASDAGAFKSSEEKPCCRGSESRRGKGYAVTVAAQSTLEVETR